MVIAYFVVAFALLMFIVRQNWKDMPGQLPYGFLIALFWPVSLVMVGSMAMWFLVEKEW